MMPIIIQNKTTEIIQNQIKTITTVQKLLYRKNKNNSIQINSNCFDDKTLVIDKFRYFTNTQKEERKLIFVLKNHSFVELD